MNLIRTILTVFLLVVFFLSILGWRWTAGDSLPPNFHVWGARLVLVISGAAALGGMAVLWTGKVRRQN